MAGRSFLVFLCLWAACAAVDWSVQTPLDEYVHRYDPYYEWEEVDIQDGDGFTLHVLNMTSQRWMDESVTVQPVLWSYLCILIPDEITVHDAAILRSAGEFTFDDPPDVNDTFMQRFGRMAVRSGAVMAQVNLVPFQPTLFTGTTIPRVEDSILAYSWMLYIEDEEEPDPEVIVQLPMVKTAKLAMDTITEYTSLVNPELNIQRYLPTGQSKRGWVAWLLAAVDSRVFAIAPIVFDLLDFTEALQLQVMSLGGWTWAFAQYVVEGVHRYPNHPRTAEIFDIIDPFAYNERLTVPKLMICAGSDEFMRPDDSHLFWDRLTGYQDNNYMLMLENAGHFHNHLHDKIYGNIESFFTSLLSEHELPRIIWEREETPEGGAISLSVDQEPSLIRAWWTETTNFTSGRRDFRQLTLNGSNPSTWQEEEVEDLGDGWYRAEFSTPEDGEWKAFFIETQFPGPGSRNLYFSSEVHIIPEEFPFPGCETEEECGSLPLV